MRIKERLLANALAAVLAEKKTEVVVRDESGSFLFHFDEEENTLRMETLEPDEPLMRFSLGGRLVVDCSPQPGSIN